MGMQLLSVATMTPCTPEDLLKYLKEGKVELEKKSGFEVTFLTEAEIPGFIQSNNLDDYWIVMTRSTPSQTFE